MTAVSERRYFSLVHGTFLIEYYFFSFGRWFFTVRTRQCWFPPTKTKNMKRLTFEEENRQDFSRDYSNLSNNYALFRQEPIINTVALSPDGKFVVAATDNNLICLWAQT